LKNEGFCSSYFPPTFPLQLIKRIPLKFRLFGAKGNLTNITIEQLKVDVKFVNNLLQCGELSEGVIKFKFKGWTRHFILFFFHTHETRSLNTSQQQGPRTDRVDERCSASNIVIT
jgi:hypothetical protein